MDPRGARAALDARAPAERADGRGERLETAPFCKAIVHHTHTRHAPTLPRDEITRADPRRATHTIADPLTGDDIRKEQSATQMKQQFTQMLNTHDLQVAKNMNPKHVKIMNGKKVARIIPIDIYPHTVDVPKRSISGVYSRQ